MRIPIRYRFILAAFSLPALLLGSIAFADSSGTLLPSSEGNYLQWTPSTGATHYTLVDESSCNGTTDYVRTTTVGQRDSYGISVSGIPNGSKITQIDITPCASRNSNGGGTSTMNVFYRFSGTDSADAGNYALTGTTPTTLATTSFTSLSHIKSASSTLEIGAVYSAGTKGARLSRVAVVVTYTTLAAPSSLGATTVSATQINLAWTDNSSIEDGFKIERSTDGGAFSQIDTAAANATSYSDITATANHEYSYRVRAYNSGGDSAYSNTASAHTYTSVPADPSSLTATASGTSIMLNWTDNSDNEKNFLIERKSGTGSYSQIASVNKNVTSYVNGPLASGTYTYRVRASNPVGNSGYSNEASAMIP